MALEEMSDDEENVENLSDTVADMPTDGLVDEFEDADNEDADSDNDSDSNVGDSDIGESDDDELTDTELAAKAEKEELESYGEKVQKRVGRAIYERNTERDRADKAEARLAQIEKENKENAVDEDKLELETYLEESKTTREGLIEDLNEAYEEGDSKAIAELTGKLSRHDAEAVQVEAALNEEQEEQTQETEAPPPEVNTAQSAKDWMAKNKWYTDPQNERLGVLAENIQDGLIDEGYELGEDLYEELDKRLLAAAPRIAVLKGGKPDKETKDDDEIEASDTSQKPNKPKSVVSGQSVGDTSIPAKSNSGKITQSDLKSMAKYNLDPNSPADRKSWLNRNSQL